MAHFARSTDHQQPLAVRRFLLAFSTCRPSSLLYRTVAYRYLGQNQKKRKRAKQEIPRKRPLLINLRNAINCALNTKSLPHFKHDAARSRWALDCLLLLA